MPLHSHKSHDRNQVAYVQTARSGVEANVNGGLFTPQHVLHAGSRVKYGASPTQLFDDVHGANRILTVGELCRVVGVYH